MIDFHSHILPAIDDGSESPEMSLQMVRALQQQGVDTICATSHFYATRRSVRRFLYRRAEAFEKLKAVLPPDAPTILLGAEVLYFPGLSRMEELPQLCLQGTRLFLLEMPFEKWSDYMIREVVDLAHDSRLQIVLAHTERYPDMRNPDVMDKFLDCGILMQSNAGYFLRFATRHRALRQLKEGRLIHLLGTDCHNMSSRAPNMAQAVELIEKKLGPAVLEDVDALGRYLLSEKPV